MESVLNQRFTDFELIIVNDGSTDNSLEVVTRNSDARIRIFNKENEGVSTARNLGITKARGKLIAFLDGDDYWEAHHLEELVTLYRAFPNAGMYCMGYCKVYSEKVKKTAVFKGIPKGFFGIVPNYFDASGIDALASSSSACVAAEVFNTIGVFDESIKSGQDIDLWIRIALRYKVALHSKVTANYAILFQNSLSKSAFVTDKINVLAKFTAEEKNNASLKKYMDLNRYALTLTYKLAGNKKLSEAARKDIDYRHLNYKQRLLLNMPVWALKLLKRIQHYLLNYHVFLSSFT